MGSWLPPSGASRARRCRSAFTGVRGSAPWPWGALSSSCRTPLSRQISTQGRSCPRWRQFRRARTQCWQESEGDRGGRALRQAETAGGLEGTFGELFDVGVVNEATTPVADILVGQVASAAQWDGRADLGCGAPCQLTSAPLRGWALCDEQTARPSRRRAGLATPQWQLGRLGRVFGARKSDPRRQQEHLLRRPYVHGPVLPEPVQDSFGASRTAQCGHQAASNGPDVTARVRPSRPPTSVRPVMSATVSSLFLLTSCALGLLWRRFRRCRISTVAMRRDSR